MSPTKKHAVRPPFESNGLTFGAGFPLTNARESRPVIERELELAKRAEILGFDALWVRDVPLYWPRFGDAGQTFDTWPWLAHVAAATEEIALGTASVVLPLRHPIHVAKSAATVDRLADGRLVLGIATGDRDPEYNAFGIDPDERGALFRESVEWIRTLWSEDFPTLDGAWGTLDGELDLVPKPSDPIPMLPTGHARQELEWIGTHGDGWLFYHLPEATLESFLEDWRAVGGEKPYTMAVRVELTDDPTAEPTQIHLGYRAGIEWFREYFAILEKQGVDHVIVGFAGDDPASALAAFGDQVVDNL